MIGLGTAWHMTVALGRVQAGQTVLVNAAGSVVGSSAIQVALLHGARVIASAGSAEKLEKARALGAAENHRLHPPEHPRGGAAAHRAGAASTW